MHKRLKKAVNWQQTDRITNITLKLAPSIMKDQLRTSLIKEQPLFMSKADVNTKLEM